MKLIFVCPETQQIFYCEKYNIIDDRGITVDVAGNKKLDARVALDEPCPFCGKQHVYHASELSCPFTGKVT